MQKNASLPGCFASFEQGIVTIGNTRITRKWKLTPRGLVAISFQWNGMEFIQSPRLPSGNVPEATWKSHVAPLRVPGVTALHAELSAAGENYRFAVTPDLPAITIFRESSKGVTCESADDFEAPTGSEVDLLATERELQVDFECFVPAHPHLRLIEFQLIDQTDGFDNLLHVMEYRLNIVEKVSKRGVIFALEDPLSKSGLVFLKLAPLPDSRPVPEAVDFSWDRERVQFPASRYPYAVIGFSGGKNGISSALQHYQRQLRQYVPGRDGIALSNTWGDRSQDRALNETFLLGEIAAAAEIGIDACQIDDGWQGGVTKNSVAAQQADGGLWEGYYGAAGEFWRVHETRFPNGFAPLLRLTKERNVGLGLWFSPDSADDFAHWRRDVDNVMKLYREYGVKWIKVDGVKTRTVAGERNLNAFFNTCFEESNGEITFDFDVTAEIRPGYFGMPEFGAIFVENRYSDFRRYWPFATFANLWNLAWVIPPLHLRMECLNPERNQEKYGNDPLAPVHYPMDWIFASIMVSSPLLWCELSSLSPHCREELKRILPLWKQYREELHGGDCLPIGDCPDGTTTSGFLTMSDDRSVCHLLLLRDLDTDASHTYSLPISCEEYDIEILTGNGSSEVVSGQIRCTLPDQRSYLWLRLKK